MNIFTSNVPKHLPRIPFTPASSITSRIAASSASSFGSSPPPDDAKFSL